MAPFKIHATPETQHLLDAQRDREQRDREQREQQIDQDAASQASTADAYSETSTENASDYIDFDTIETYTANVQNKKRVFADEVLRV
jgi:hypothetical protein